MKLCLACEKEFEQSHWMCPHCSWSPPLIDGFHSFSPELAHHNNGLAACAHHALNEFQEQSFWFRERNRIIQSMIKRYFIKASDILEIGCGSGYVLSAIRNLLPTARLTATEIYSNGLNYTAQKISSPSQFLQVDARKLPFKKEFDLIGAFDVLEHIDEDNIVMQNIHHALKPNGGVIITVPQHTWLWSKADEYACHKRRYSQKQLESLFHCYGFKILLNTSFMFFLLPVMLIQRLMMNRKTTYDIKHELILPKILDKTFEACLRCEHWAIQQGVRFPIGGSRLVVAKLS